ncbi:hypothetical protein V6N13_092043 [Hibiscus sabdariffa]
MHCCNLNSVAECPAVPLHVSTTSSGAAVPNASKQRSINLRLRSNTVPRSSKGLSNTTAFRPSHKFQHIDPNNRS